ncbi:type II toxin-antitoxin system RelE/ParE family toxin [Jiangella muralis]|uniref:type II toxin-antitoxin system RelE/ParE family toxin n=1 Tax=Jiangella muralis TaxID=702383 RepID=UPI00069DFC7C|nr:type II toxin-antitoxin system RelE/ParE family toxin [Jiangella muralis]
MTWTVNMHDSVTEWLDSLAGKPKDHALASIDMLQADGPGLRRPVVGKIEGSRHNNMKELITKTVRILFVFDPNREAILLVAGDKSDDWRGWYKTAIPLADNRYDEWLAWLEQQKKGRK